MKDLRKSGQTIWIPTLKDRHPVEMFQLKKYDAYSNSNQDDFLDP
jgi:hypothetical protein